MPILAIDKLGRYYETDPDSSDGDGCKGVVPRSSGGDITFDGSIARADAQRLNNQARANLGFAIIDKKEADQAAQDKRQANARAVAAENANYNAHKPENMKKLVDEGLRQSRELNYSSDSTVGISGNGLSANGLMGRAGMNRHQLGAEMALGLGIFARKPGTPIVAMPSNAPGADEAPITQVEDSEKAQYRSQQLLQAQASLSAKQQARINELEALAEQQDYSPSRPTKIHAGLYENYQQREIDPEAFTPGKSAYAAVKNTLPAQTVKVVHPFMILFLIPKMQGA